MPPIRKLNKKAAHLLIFAFARCAREHLVLVTVLAAEEHLLFGVRFHRSIEALRAACRHVPIELAALIFMLHRCCRRRRAICASACAQDAFMVAEEHGVHVCGDCGCAMLIWVKSSWSEAHVQERKGSNFSGAPPGDPSSQAQITR